MTTKHIYSARYKASKKGVCDVDFYVQTDWVTEAEKENALDVKAQKDKPDYTSHRRITAIKKVY